MRAGQYRRPETATCERWPRPWPCPSPGRRSSTAPPRPARAPRRRPRRSRGRRGLAGGRAWRVASARVGGSPSGGRGEPRRRPSPHPRGRGPSAGAGDLAAEHGLRGPEHHRHVAPVLDRPLLDGADLGELLGEAVEDHHAALGVRDLAAAEHDRDLDLVLVAQEALDMALLGLVVVLRDLRAELDLADRDLLLVLARLLELLGLLVLVLGVVQHAADGRPRLGRDLHEVEIAILRVAQRIGRPHDADLVSGLVDQAYLGHANAIVDPCRVPLGRAPVESARDRHYERRLRVKLWASAAMNFES